MAVDGRGGAVVIHVLASFGNHDASRFAIGLAAAQALRGRDVRVAAPGGGGQDVPEILRDRAVALTGAPGPVAAFEVGRLVRSHGDVIVHTHGAAAKRRGLLAARLARARGVVHTVVRYGAHDGALDVGFPQLADQFVAHSRAAADVVARQVGHDRVREVPRGVDPVGRPRSGLDGEPLRIGVPSGVSAAAVLPLLRAVALLRARLQPTVTIIGPKPDRAAITAQAEGLKLADRVRFGDDAVAWGETDLAAHLEAQTEVPLGVLEAAASGVPAIVRPDGGGREALAAGLGGFVCEAEPQPLADRIAAYAALAVADRRALGDAALRAVTDHYAIDRVADQVEAAYAAL